MRNFDKEHIGCLIHLLNLIFKRFFNCKIFDSQLDESQDENSDEGEFDNIFDDNDDNMDNNFNESGESDTEYTGESYTATQRLALAKALDRFLKVKKIVKLFNKSNLLSEQLK